MAGLGWGTTDEGLHVFYPDEYTHARIAKSFATRIVEPQWYVKAYPAQIALASFLLLQKNYLPDDDPVNNEAYFILLGRFLSLLYGAALIILVFFIGNHFGGFKAGLFASLSLAVMDLFVSFSHLAVPVVSSAFWFLLATFLIYLAHKKPSQFLDLSAMAASTICLATKLNFMPLAFLVIMFALRKEELTKKARTFAMLFFVFISTYWLANGSLATYKDISLTVGASIGVNFIDQIPDKQLLLNPLLFFFAVLAGSSLLTLASALLGAKKFWDGKKDAGFWLFIVAPVLAWLAVSSLRPNVFPRSIIELFPLMALFSGFFVASLFRERKFHIAVIAAAVLIIYPLGLTLSSQGEFAHDNRFHAYDWLSENTSPGEEVLASRYVFSDSGEEPPAITLGEADYIVLHEFYYGRYVKKFTSGFGTPKCVSGVHHPTSIENCEAIQKLVLDTPESGYSLAKEFRVENPFAERVVFKEFFGMYTPNAGDILIFRKN